MTQVARKAQVAGKHVIGLARFSIVATILCMLGVGSVSAENRCLEVWCNAYERAEYRCELSAASRCEEAEITQCVAECPWFIPPVLCEQLCYNTIDDAAVDECVGYISHSCQLSYSGFRWGRCLCEDHPESIHCVSGTFFPPDSVWPNLLEQCSNL